MGNIFEQFLPQSRRATSGPDEFVSQYSTTLQIISERIGVSPRVIAAQFGLETGWGRAVIPGTNNLGNIKDFSGGGVAATDNMTGSRDKYRAYESPEQFANDYVSLIEKRYPNAIGAGDDPVRFASALKAGGYAEDPNYVRKVVAAYDMTPPMDDRAPSQRRGGNIFEQFLENNDSAVRAESTRKTPSKYVPYEDFLSAIKATPEGAGLSNGAIAKEWMATYGRMTPPKDPTLWERVKQGAKSTVAAGRIAATNDEREIAGITAELEKDRIAPSRAAQAMQAEIEPLQKEYESAEGSDAVWAGAKLAAKRLQQMVTNPREFAGMVAENLPNSAPGLAAALAGGATGAKVGALAGPKGAAVGGVVGAVGGGFLGGYGVEQGSAMIELIRDGAREAGVDITNADALAQFMAGKYPEFLEKSRWKGVGTAGTDAVLNVTALRLAGIGGRVIVRDAAEVAAARKAGRITAEEAAQSLASLEAKEAARQTLRAKAMRGGAVIGMEMGGEMASEAVGQQLAHGKINLLEVIDEGLVGIGSGAVMAAGRGTFDRLTGGQADPVQTALKAASDAVAAANKPRPPTVAEGMAKIASSATVDEALKHAEETALAPVGSKMALPEITAGAVTQEQRLWMNRRIADENIQAARQAEIESAKEADYSKIIQESRLPAAEFDVARDQQTGAAAMAEAPNAMQLALQRAMERRQQRAAPTPQPTAASDVAPQQASASPIQNAVSPIPASQPVPQNIRPTQAPSQNTQQKQDVAENSLLTSTPVMKPTETTQAVETQDKNAVVKIGGRSVLEIPLVQLRKFAEKGGDVVKAKAQAEIARREENDRINAEAKAAAAKLKDTPSNDLLKIIIAAGGINKDRALDVAGDKGIRGLGGNANRIFRQQKKNAAGVIVQGHGTDASEFAETLIREGYLTQQQWDADGSNIVERLVRDAIHGQLEPITEAQVRKAAQADAEARAKAEDAADAADVPEFEREYNALTDAERAEIDAYVDEVVAEIGQWRLDEIKERIALQTDSEVAYAKALREALEHELANPGAAIKAPRTAAGETRDGGRDGGEEGRGADGDARQASAQVAPLTLTSQSPEDLTAAAEKQRAAEAAKAEEKAIADREREQPLTLTPPAGAVTQAPQNAPTNQQDMFVQSMTEAATAIKDMAQSVKAMVTDAKAKPAEQAQSTAPETQEQDQRPAEGKAGNAQPINDVGEELWYNRRNAIGKGLKWEDVKDLNPTLKVREVVKSKVWSRPDYEELVDGGMNNMTAYFVKLAYDAIPTKPAGDTDADLKAYVGAVSNAREKVIEWAKDETAQTNLREYVRGRAELITRRGAISLTSIARMDRPTELLDAIFPVAPNIDKRARFREQNTLLDKAAARALGNKFVRAVQFDENDAVAAMKAIEQGWPAPQEAWQKRYDIREWKAGDKVFRKGGTVTLSEDEFEVVTKTKGAYKRIVADGLKTRDEAIAKAKSLTERDRNGGMEEERLPLSEMRREGAQRRKPGQDITSKRLMDEFGFRGVNYGNWVNDAERQAFTNNAYDALYDLAEILNVPPKALSLNGMLGLAFGAQGRGGIFAAHFVPGVNEINLTKTKGAGALAHEFGHALDHYFAVQAGDKYAKAQEPFMTHFAKVEGAVRPEIADAFQKIVGAMRGKPETAEEVSARIAQSRKDDVTRLDRRIAEMRKNMEIRLKPDDSVRVLTEFDQLAERMKRGDLGDGMVMLSKSRKNGNAVHDVVAQVRNLYKDSTGQVPYVDDVMRLQWAAAAIKFQKDAQQQAMVHKPQTKPTSFLKAANKADAEKGGQVYWSQPTELFARSFQSYVMDKLRDRAARNDFLTHPQPPVERLRYPDKDPYPRGDERAAINTAFDRLVSEIKTRETDSGTAMFSRADTQFATNIVEELSSYDEVFRYPVSKSGDLQTVFAEVAPNMKFVGNDTRADEDSESTADRRFLFKTPAGKDFHIYERGNDVWLDVSKLSPGDMGNAIYAATLNYAHNRRKRLIGDPQGLSQDAVVRRTNAMLSSALRFGTTRHMAAAQEQRQGNAKAGIKPLEWGAVDAENVRSLIDTFVDTAYNLNPELKGFRYDFTRLQFVDADGRRVGREAFVEAAAGSGARRARAGSSTLQRAVFLKSLVSSESSQRPGILEQVLNRGRQLVARGNLDGVFSRDKAPPSEGLSVSDLRAEIQPILRNWNNAPEVVFIESMDQAPEPVRNYDEKMRSQGATGQPEGFWWGGKVYLVADGINSAERARTVIFHEALGHYGLNGVFGESLKPILKQLVSARRSDVAKKAEQYGLDMSKESDRLIAAEEVLAELAQTRPEIGFVRRAIAAIRTFLRDIGIDLKLTSDEVIANYITPARRFVESGGKADDMRVFGEPAFMVAYHGSPHDFDKFSTDKIGTGEGAQAYGYGLYFAGRKEVAEHYRRSLSGTATSNYLYDGKRVLPSALDYAARARYELSYAAYVGPKNTAVERAKNNIRNVAKMRGKLDAFYDRVLSELDKLDVNKTSFKNERPGKLYQVNLTPAEDEYLLWDKPLSEQSEKVRRSVTEALNDSGFSFRAIDKFTGQQAYDALSHKFLNDQAASKFLASIGIPGIKYLDGSSRGKGDGSYNYVIFSDDQLQIEAKFSRSVPQRIIDSAPQTVQDILVSDRKLNRVISKVNTPFHISETQPEFKPVYQRAQEFMRDVSSLSLSAADEAKDLLPRVESWKDVLPQVLGGKGVKAPTTQDIEAINRALYVGTFYGGGNPMEGVQWTDDELRGNEVVGRPIPAALKNNPLNDKQIGLYRQALAAVANSLEEHSKSLVWRLARRQGIVLDRETDITGMADAAREQIDEKIAGLRGQVDAAEVTEVEQSAKDIELSSNEIKELNGLKDAIDDIESKTNTLIEKGYFPAMRFGEYFTYVYRINKDGERQTVHFARYEREAEKNQAARELRTRYPDAEVESGTMNTSAHKLMAGMSLDTMEMFIDHIKTTAEDSAELDPLMQEFLRLAATERSTLAREIHRQGVPGQSMDIPRVLAQFIMSNARNAASTYHTADMLKSVQAIESGDLARYATDYVRYLQDPAEGAAALRGFIANYYLMGSVAFGAINMTQPVLVTIPTLSRHVSAAKATAYVTKAAMDVVRGKASLAADERKAFEQASEAGIVSPQEIHQLRAESGDSFTDGPLWRATQRAAKSVGVSLPGGLAARKALHAWGSIYALTEQFNRGTSFIAAYRAAKDDGMADPYEFASKMVEETQFTYSKANRPEIMRGPVGAIALQFKQFSISYVELASRLYRADKKAFGLMMLALFAAAGAEGLPGAEDLEDVIDSIGQKLGFATNSKKTLRKLATEFVGKDMADILLHGVSAIPGFPLDVSQRMGMHNLIPGTAMFKDSEPDKTRELVGILGPTAGIVDRLVFKGDVSAALPKAIQDLVKAQDMAVHDMYRDAKGKKVIETDLADAFFKGVGFMPASVARSSRIEYQEKQDITLQKTIEAGIADKWAQGLFERDPQKVADAREKLRQWNEDNPSLPIRIQLPQIARRVQEMRKTREERFVRQAAPEIRGNTKREMQEAR